MKKIFTIVLFGLLVMAGPALAAINEAEGSSMMIKLFLGFFAMIIVCQLIPGLSLFVSMLKGLFGRVPEKSSLVEK